MQPKMCTKCKKNVAVVFITKMENGVTLNEGYCLRCARSLGIPQIDQAVKQMGFSEDDLDNLSDEMSSMFGQIDQGDHDDDDMDSQTATFPMLNQLFGSAPNMPSKPAEPAPKKEAEPEDGGKKKNKEKTADQLSKGNQQKIQLMAALLSDPEFIVLDEPLSGLDPVNTDLFKGIIKELIENKKYVIMSSHQMATIEQFCSNITILNRGETVLQGDLNQIKKEYGRVNMMMKCDQDIKPYLEQFEMKILNETPDGYQLKVSSQEQAAALLSRLIEDKITVVRYELREPSLHEIFVEKVGGASDEE